MTPLTPPNPIAQATGPCDVMIDIECLSTLPDAAIASIGAVRFDPLTGLVTEPQHWVVDIGDSIRRGGRVDGETLCWWLQQSDAARAALTTGPRLQLTSALLLLSKYLRATAPIDEVRVWANGADFDLPILASAYARCGVPQPWRYFNTRCMRTLRKLHPDEPAPAFEGVQHHAGHDALHQARHALRILAHMALLRIHARQRPEITHVEPTR
jgi:hypothetical protein